MKYLKTLIVLIAFWAVSTNIIADDNKYVGNKTLSVDEFKVLPMDLTAATSGRKDLNGQYCALIKVSFDESDANFRGNIVGDVALHTNEYWVYMTEGTKHVRISIPGAETLTVNFGKFGIPHLKSKMTYALTVKAFRYTASIHRSNLNQALIDYSNGQYNRALGLFLSEPDNPVAQRNIGIMYLYGEGIPANEKTGLEWLDKAKDQNDSEAFIEHGLYILTKSDSYQSGNKAFQLFKTAADLGNSQGYTCIARMYKEGLGLPVDYSKSVKWFEKAIALGNQDAMCGLGHMYLTGTGIQQDYSKARRLFEQSLEINSSLTNLGFIYLNGLGVPADYEKARDYYLRASKSGDGYAYYVLSHIYKKGLGVPVDEGLAFEYAKMAVDYGEMEGLPELAYYYYTGYGTEKNLEKAKELFEYSARQGNEESKKWVDYLNNIQEPHN